VLARAGDGGSRGREMAGPEAIHGVRVWAKSPKNL